MFGIKQKQRNIYSCENCGITGFNEDVYLIGTQETWCINCIVGLANIGLGYIRHDDSLIQKFIGLLKEREIKK